MHLISFVLLFSFALFVQGQSECTGEFGEKGECIPARECPQVVEVLNNAKLTGKEKYDILIKYKCSGGKACCPINGSIQVRGATPDKTTITSDLLPSRDECGKFPVKKIFGGDDAGIFEYPWATLLQYRKPNGERAFSCGGSLINNRYILTAAHCVKLSLKQRNWGLLSARLGETTIGSDPDCNRDNECNKTPFDITISDKIVHENYDPVNKVNDIALLRLARNVTYTDFIKPVCLPLSYEEQKDTYENRNLTVTGWGITENGFAAKTKQVLKVPVMPLLQCKQKFTVNNLHICAGGEEGKDSCNGDSGGGLVVLNPNNNWIITGVVSYGLTYCGTKGHPGVYAKVGEYMDWILKNIKP